MGNLRVIGQRDLVKTITSLLSEYKINYLLTGSLAVSYYGIPRATHDIDFVIEAWQKDLLQLLQAVKGLGKDFFINEQDIKEAVAKQTQFNLYHPATGIKIDFWLVKKDTYEQIKFKRGKEVRFDKQKINIISAEDLILTKLLWSKKIKSERHLQDCVGILRIQKNKLDKNYLDLWAEKLGIIELLNGVAALSPRP